MNDKQLTYNRRWKIEFVFQFDNLAPSLTATGHAELVIEFSNNPIETNNTLDLVGHFKRVDAFPSRLSGGEQLRVFVAHYYGTACHFVL